MQSIPLRAAPKIQGVPILLLLILLTLLVPHAKGQSATLRGTVTDNLGQPVIDAHVMVDGNRFHAVTDSTGAFRIQGIPPGRYPLKVSHIGFHTHKEQIELEVPTVLRLTVTLRPRYFRSPTMVVTATRTRRDIEEVPEPVTVIKKQEIERTGSLRLSEVLAEQTGLRLVSDHGTGVQVQGFDPEYTLIMLDGQPLIGRTAGTFDLSRVTVNNISQIEMIKGPSSALWGSDAMAGVINIITEEGSRPLEADLSTQYGSNRTLDLGANVSWNRGTWHNDLSLNRNSSGGYRLVPGSLSRTVPSYRNYTGTYRTELDLTGRIRLRVRGRYYHEHQQGTDYLGSSEDPTLLDRRAVQEDFSITPSLEITLSPRLDLELEYYNSRYRTEQTYTYRQNGERYERETFDQRYHKTEARSIRRWDDTHITTLGGGYTRERLIAERYSGSPAFHNLFLFGQHEWRPLEKMDLVAGFRYDAHSEYTNQVSPKFSARYEVTDWLQLRGSAGRGFKAPDFRQLFLNFTNPTVGYSVYGSTSVREQIHQLQEEGKISDILIPLDRIEEIRAERSWAYNAGIDLHPQPGLEFRVNLFRNDVDDLIETAPVARKTNGQSAFSYFNLEEIYTQGVEATLRWNPLPAADFSAGYQLLDARRRIEETVTVQDQNGNPVQRTQIRHEPMFNRSRHSANITFFYHFESPGLEAGIRGRWRGRYGRIDANGNGYVNGGEYEEGYSIWNASLAKAIAGRHKVRLGVENLFDFTRPRALSFLPGRTWYLQLSMQLH